MKIESIKIEGLFELFDYDIILGSEENVLIITGPNGFGKTMVLNVVFNLFNKNLRFFQNLIFNRITLLLEGDLRINISKIRQANPKKTNSTNTTTKLSIHYKAQELDSITLDNHLNRELERAIGRYMPIHQIEADQWIEPRTGRIMSTDEVFVEYADQLPDEFRKNTLRLRNERAVNVLDSIKVHLIREQRLFKKVPVRGDKPYREEKEQTLMIETIQTYAKELKQLIATYSQRSLTESQYLDSSYPDRLISERSRVSEEEYNNRFNKLKGKEEKLTKFGVYESRQKVLAYSEDDAKALLVYLNDLEKKLGVFDTLLEKLELFTTILNERRFTFKKINVDKEKGFYFNTINNKELKLNQLSSGEQHEVVLLYELIFNTNQNTLVLIDEPEISLHISWQKEFLNDLLKIIEIQNIQVIIATHSPSIINDRWDLVYNLEKTDSE